MAENQESSFSHTNYFVFYKIVKESYEAMIEEDKSRRRPKPGGKPGSIITYDPDQKSFKNAFIVIVFCGVFIESLLHLLIVKHKGIKTFNKYDKKPLEKKLELLGCEEQSILELCGKFREIRREIVHEKAHLDNGLVCYAQEEAEIAFELVNKICATFQVVME